MTVPPPYPAYPAPISLCVAIAMLGTGHRTIDVYAPPCLDSAIAKKVGEVLISAFGEITFRLYDPSEHDTIYDLGLKPPLPSAIQVVLGFEAEVVVPSLVLALGRALPGVVLAFNSPNNAKLRRP